MQEIIKEKLLSTLNAHFNFPAFRPGQLEALLVLMQHGRLLCIHPTGSGKSLLYQVPAMLLDGLTIVISPLLALMRDQLNQLKNRFGISAASINSDQNEVENNLARQAAKDGSIRILFIAPEQLEQLDKFNFLLQLPINFLVVDEAHCISTWGHDFRPSYRRIIKLAAALTEKNPQLKLLALTATANKKTEMDIKLQLRVDKQQVIVQRASMDRPNIKLNVIHTKGVVAKLATLIELLPTKIGSGLIYCATRENTELVAEFLNTKKLNVIAYHAGLGTKKKCEIQNAFLADQYPLVVATNALGMGIDKPNLRFVIHFDFPGSITAYYQEVGRAGRDGKDAEGILFYDAADSKIHKYFIAASYPSSKDYQQVLSVIPQMETTLSTLKEKTGIHPIKLNIILAELSEQGFVHKVSKNGIRLYQYSGKSGMPNLSRDKNQLKVKMEELTAIQRYAEHAKNCLMKTLRCALGEKRAANCKKCSNCHKVNYNWDEDENLLTAIAMWIRKRP